MQIKVEDPAETLYLVARHVCAITLAGYLKASDDAKFKDVANAMLEAESNPHYKEVIRKEFERRLIFDSIIRSRSYDRHIAFHACGAIQALHDAKVKETLEEALKDFKPINPNLSQSESSLNKSNGDLNKSAGSLSKSKESLNESKTDETDEKANLLLKQTNIGIHQSNTSLHGSKDSLHAEDSLWQRETNLDQSETNENQSNPSIEDSKDSETASESDVKITMSDLQDFLDGDEK